MSQTQRQSLLAVLSKSAYEDIHNSWQLLGINPGYHCLKEPEIGMVMVKGKAGGNGQPFNLGEMTVTRTVVQLDTQQLGFGYTAGRDKEKSKLVAIIDACFQLPEYISLIEKKLINPLSEKLKHKHQQLDENVEATKVNFFTMVRGQ